MDIDDPFQVFPEEIWEIILDNCPDSSSIANVLEIFPQLKILSRGKQFSWLIGDILPLIFPKLIRFSDVKNCRFVSKRWRNGIDRTLETHSDLSPYVASTSGSKSETHFNYHVLPQITTDIFKFLLTELNEHRTIEAIWTITNPFPGRSVRVTLNHVYDKTRHDQGLSNFSVNCCRSIPFRMRIGGDPKRQIVSTLQRVGHHIFYSTFKLPAIRYWIEELHIVELMQCLIQCLSSLPNLKSLKLKAFGPVSADISDNDRKNIIVAALTDACIPAQIEALDLWDFGRTCIPRDLFNSILAIFVNHDQVKKLAIYAGHWSKDLSIRLPNLTELCLQECNPPSEEFSLNNILKQLINFPYLKKLRVRGYEINVNKIVQLISEFQNIESLEVTGEKYVEASPKQNNTHKSVVSKITKKFFPRDDNGTGNSSSILYLKIRAIPHMNFQFLSELPSLQTLTVTVDDINRYHFHQEDTNDLMSICLHKICNRNLSDLKSFSLLWEGYPELNMVNFETVDGMYQIIRENPHKVFTSTCLDLTESID